MAIAKEPIYATLARDLAQRISNKEFPVGSLLPTEQQLCTEYQVSRHTIREALRELSDIGLVSRKKHVGTTVEEIKQLSRNEHSLATLEDLLTLANTHIRVVLEIETVTADQALVDLIGCALGSRWLRIVSVRENDQDKTRPICITNSYVSEIYRDIGKLVQKDPFALISDLIEKQYGRRSIEVQQTITAVAINAEEAEVLNAEVGSPALKIIRQYKDRLGKMFETTVSIHPMGRYSCSVVLKRVEKNHLDSESI